MFVNIADVRIVEANFYEIPLSPILYIYSLFTIQVCFLCWTKYQFRKSKQVFSTPGIVEEKAEGNYFLSLPKELNKGVKRFNPL